MTEHFFIIGAQRCATSYLYRLLDEHPEIAMAAPMFPEPKFFLRDSLTTNHLGQYREYFSEVSGAPWLCGEKSTSYLESETAARNIAQFYPKAKLLVSLRDPVDRAISNFQFSTEHGVETGSIEEAFYHEEERRGDFDRSRFSVSPFDYLQRGCYARYLDVFLQYFPREQFHFLLFEEFIGSQQVFSRLCDFLGVSTFRSNRLSEVVNEGGGETAGLSAELRRYLDDFFRPWNEQLSMEFGIDVVTWH